MDDKPKPKLDAPRLLIPEEAIPFQTSISGQPVWYEGESGELMMARLRAVVRRLEEAGEIPRLSRQRKK